MKRLTQQVGLAVMLAVSACGYAEVRDDALLERRLIRNIKAATDWVVEEGIATYYQEGGSKGFGGYLWEKWEVSNAGLDMPFVETKGHLAKFRLATKWVGYVIFDLYRETLPGGIYEFWIVRVGRTYHKSSDTDRCMFYVTRADEVRGRREIVQKSDRFIVRYEVAPGTYFDFPVDDLEVVRKMDAWRYPESYPDSDLKNLKVTKHWRTGRITVERGDGEEWAYEEDRGGNLMMLAETTHAFKRAIRAGETYSEEDWEEVYEGLVRIINRGRPIKEKDWKRYYKRRFNKLERLDKTAAKTRFDAKERLNIEWKDKK